MSEQRTVNYYRFQEHLKSTYDYIGWRDAIEEAKRLHYKVTGREVVQICKDLYEW